MKKDDKKVSAGSFNFLSNRTMKNKQLTLLAVFENCYHKRLFTMDHSKIWLIINLADTLTKQKIFANGA